MINKKHNKGGNMKRFFYYLVVIGIGGFLIYNLYNSKALFTVKADIESKTYEINQLFDSLK